MDCRDVRRFLHAYLDGEFDEQERICMAAHLESCDSCQRLARFEQIYRQKVHQHYQPERAPAWLEQRVRRALRQVEPSARKIRFGWLKWLVPATVATALLVAGVVAYFAPRSSVQSVLAAESIEWHRRNLPMDVSGPSLETVRRFFSDKVPFAVRPPVFDRVRARLVGGRLSNLKEHRAAYLIYQVGGQRVSVFIFDPAALIPGRSRGWRQTQEGIHWHNLKGYNVATYVSRGTGYAVASEMDPRRMIRLISHSR
jgi:anti-sigma factor (TIGR02949 family)